MNKLEEILKKIQDEFKAIFIKKDNNSSDAIEQDAKEDITETTEATQKKNSLQSLDVATLKKKTPMIILIIALIYLVIDEFSVKENVDTKPNQVINKKAAKKKKRIIKNVKKEPEVKVVKRVKEVNRKAKKPQVEKKPKAEKKIKVKKVQEEPPKDTNKVDASEVPFETAITVESPRAVGENNENIKKEEITLEDSIKNAVETVSEEDELADDYISPPRYNRFGRGLVYNCKGKHWACVDQYSYLTCRENEKWNKQKNKKIECKTKNVYATSSDCIKVQTYYTNNSENTDFCKRTN